MANLSTNEKVIEAHRRESTIPKVKIFNNPKMTKRDNIGLRVKTRDPIN